MNSPTRRRFMQHTLRRSLGMAPVAKLATLAVLGVPGAQAASRLTLAEPARTLALAHTHTGEQLDLVYAQATDYLPPALQRLDHFLRDHRNGEVGHIDPRLFDLLHGMHRLLGWDRPFQVISGYRSAATNRTLQRTGGGGVATHSLHLTGQAIDVRLPGVPLAELRDAALALQGGGVGHYPREDFVHIDTGRVRRW